MAEVISIKTFSKLTLVVLLAFPLNSCDEAEKKVESIIYGGTHLGVQKCIDRNKTKTVSINAIRQACARKHKKRMYISLTGKVGYHKSYGLRRFSGRLKNKSIDKIAISFTISIKHKNHHFYKA